MRREFPARVILHEGGVVVVPADPQALAEWKEGHEGQVFAVRDNSGSGLSLVRLGREEIACREPINITSKAPAPYCLISNFGATPFVFEGQRYASIESFWQGLKFEDRGERVAIAALDAPIARRKGNERGYGRTIEWAGREIPVGTWEHWQLMWAACEAKFAQVQEAREALLSTAPRPLVHRVRRDSRTIPGVVMAEIWTRIRKRILNAVADESA